jgi:restriction system protein
MQRRFGRGSFFYEKIAVMRASRGGSMLLAVATWMGPAAFEKAIGVAIVTTLLLRQFVPFSSAFGAGMSIGVGVVSLLGALRMFHASVLVAEIFATHGQELGINKRRMVVPASYGQADTSRWVKEMGRFAERVVVPALGAMATEIDWKHLFLAIDDVADDAIAALPKHAYSDDMDPFDYEHLCAQLLVDAGWEAHATKASGDQGADVLAERNGARAVLQCKLYSNPVGNKAVQEAHAARGFYQAKWAVVVSNRTYTPSARELAQSLGVILVHHDELVSLHEVLEA